MESELIARLSAGVMSDGSCRLPKLPFIVKARFVSQKAECVFRFVVTRRHVLTTLAGPKSRRLVELYRWLHRLPLVRFHMFSLLFYYHVHDT